MPVASRWPVGCERERVNTTSPNEQRPSIPISNLLSSRALDLYFSTKAHIFYEAKPPTWKIEVKKNLGKWKYRTPVKPGVQNFRLDPDPKKEPGQNSLPIIYELLWKQTIQPAILEPFSILSVRETNHSKPMYEDTQEELTVVAIVDNRGRYCSQECFGLNVP